MIFEFNRLLQVLVAGGGNGGVLREISWHGFVEWIDICEIDTMVMEVGRLYCILLGCYVTIGNLKSGC